jgi:hypothetical protein
MVAQEVGVAHGGLMAIYTDELMLTNLNIFCVNKGMFGNTKTVFCYPLNQIKIFNGKPQVVTGKLSNGMSTLDIYFQNGNESFRFQSQNKNKITRWTKLICKIILGDHSQEIEFLEEDEKNSGIDLDSPIGQVKEAWNGIKSELGFIPTKKKTSASAVPQPESIRVNKKCIFCSAPLIGIKGQMVHCNYCDADQTL